MTFLFIVRSGEGDRDGTVGVSAGMVSFFFFSAGEEEEEESNRPLIFFNALP